MVAGSVVFGGDGCAVVRRLFARLYICSHSSSVRVLGRILASIASNSSWFFFSILCCSMMHLWLSAMEASRMILLASS